MADDKAADGGTASTDNALHRPVFAAIALLFGAFLANLDGRLFSIGLPDLRGGLSLTFDEGAWLSTAATASQIIIAPAVPWLAVTFGLRRIIGIPSLVYALVSLLIPLARDYNLLLALNVVHGLLLGTFVPATLLIIFRNLPMKWWLAAIAVYAIRVGLSLNSGISLVGFYVEHVGWEWLYWQDAIVAPLMGLFVYLGTPRDAVNAKQLREADWGGMLLLGAGMAAIYAGLDQGNRLDWFESGTIVALIAGGTVLTVGFFVNEALVRSPWAHVEILFSRNVALCLMLITFYILTSLSNSALAPNFLSTVAGLRPEQSGSLFLTFGVLPMLVLTPLSVFLVSRFDARYLLIVGLAAFGVAGFLGTRITHDWAAPDFIPMLLLQSVGQAFALFPIIVIAIANADLARAAAFAAYIQVFRLVSAEIGLALMSTWLRVREQTHSNTLGQHVAIGDADVTALLAKLSGRLAGHDASSAPAQALSSLAALVQREANTLAYIDGFWLTVWFAIGALVLVALLGDSPNGPLTPRPRSRQMHARGRPENEDGAPMAPRPSRASFRG
jgi:DHA2 family multidrug resistance protein